MRTTPKFQGLIWLPEGFDPYDHLTAPYWRGEPADRMKAFIGTVFNQYRMFKDPDMYVFVPRETTYGIFGGRTEVKKHTDVLLDRGILECDGKSKKGEKVYGWKPGPEWLNKSLLPTSVKSEKIKLILADYEARRSRIADWLPAHRHWVGMFPRIGINEGKAGRCLDKMKRRLPGVADASDRKKNKMWQRYLQSQLAVSTLLVGYPRVTLGDCGRLYTLFNQMRRVLRSYLTIDQMSIIERDIASCQPYILALLYRILHVLGISFDQSPSQVIPKLFLPSGPLYFASLVSPPRHVPSPLSVFSTSPSIMCMPDAPIERLSTIPSNVVSLIESHESGDYWGVAEEGMKTNGKQRTKATINRMMYGPHGPNINPKHSELDRHFMGERWRAKWGRYSRWQPEIAAMVEWLKSDSYFDVHSILTQIETGMMVRGFGEITRTEHPDLAFFGIHDGIGSTERDMDLSDSITGRCWKPLGGKPFIK
jgi:hypothetical protein